MEALQTVFSDYTLILDILYCFYNYYLMSVLQKIFALVLVLTCLLSGVVSAKNAAPKKAAEAKKPAPAKPEAAKGKAKAKPVEEDDDDEDDEEEAPKKPAKAEKKAEPAKPAKPAKAGKGKGK